MKVFRHAAGTPASTLIVLLPGAYMTPAQFVDAGFVSALTAHGIAADLAVAGLDLEAITDGSALPAVREEIILPARRAGYRQIWLGGISLGGFLSLLYAARHGSVAGGIDGLCLLAPYPGSRITINAIAAAGGLAAWSPTTAQLDDPEFELWDWLRRSQSASPALPIHIDYGREDRFASGMATLAAALPQASVQTRPGGHDWPVWRAAWDDFLASGMLSQHAGALS